MRGSLDPRHVPAGVESLFPLVEQWGLEDDVARSAKVGEAPLGELRSLVRAVDAVDDDVLYTWLAGSESWLRAVSDEYAAITAVTMAADQARVRLRREGSVQAPD